MRTEELDCIKTYSCVVDAILNKALSPNDTTIASGLALIAKVKNMNKNLSEQMELYLNIARCLVADSSDKDRYKNFLEHHKTRKGPFKSPVLIIGGGASLMDKTKIENYRNFIMKMINGFKGTIISGGTTAGIPGLVGEVKSDLEKENALDFILIAYLPRQLPADTAKSVAYDYFYETDSDHFSVLEILTYWCDLVGNGINPADVKLVGIEGGDIASIEYRIALSLGAKVGLVADSGRAASELFHDETWKHHRNLLEFSTDVPAII